MILALILPEGSRAAQNPIGFMGRKSLERSQPIAGGYMGSHQQMHVRGHDDIGMKLVAMKTGFAIVHCLDQQLCDLRLLQEHRTGSGPGREDGPGPQRRDRN